MDTLFLAYVKNYKTIVQGCKKSGTGGAVATFDAFPNTPIENLIVGYNATQDGSGTPSPDNIREIIGWNEIEITLSPTLYSEDGKTLVVELGDTYYGGTIDISKGILTVTHKLATIRDLTWLYNAQYTRCYAQLEGMVTNKYGTRAQPFLASCFLTVDDGRSLAQVPVNAIYGSGTNDYCYIKTTCESTEEFVEEFGDETILYELATPETYNINKSRILTFNGTNNLWANCGNIISFEYYGD